MDTFSFTEVYIVSTIVAGLFETIKMEKTVDRIFMDCLKAGKCHRGEKPDVRKYVVLQTCFLSCVPVLNTIVAIGNILKQLVSSK